MARTGGADKVTTAGEVRFPAHEAITWTLDGSSLGAELVHRAEGQARIPNGRRVRARVYLDGAAFVVRFYVSIPRKKADPGVDEVLPEFPTRLPPPMQRRPVDHSSDTQKSVPMEMDPGAIYEALRDRGPGAL